MKTRYWNVQDIQNNAKDDTALRLSFTMKSIPLLTGFFSTFQTPLTWALARKRPCKNHGKASSARRLPLEADDWWSICWEDLRNLYPQILSLMMEGVLIQPSDGAWIGFQPAVRYVDPKLGWVNVFCGGGPVGRVVARNFPILQIHPQFGYSTFLGVFPHSCIRWRLRFHSWNQRFYLF